jgi:hypothetical protein
MHIPLRGHPPLHSPVLPAMRRSFRHSVLAAPLAVALVALTACGSSARRPPGAANMSSSTGSRVITREQIATLNVLDAYAVIERLSGYRLAENSRGGVSIRQRRGQTSLTNPNADRPVLVVDGAQMSDFEMLHRIRSNEIERIELISPGDATQRFGTQSSGAGAIIIVTRSRP